MSFAAEPGSAVGPRRPQRLGQDDAAAPARRDHQAHRRARRGRRPRRLAARARSGLPAGLHRPRERLPQRLDPRAQARQDPRADGRDRRLRRPRALHRPPRPHLLLRDGDAARLRGRGHIEADVLLLDEVFAVGDEEFQRKCFGKIFEFKQRGGTIVFVSHDASSVERLCDRAVLLKAGRVEFDGPTHEAIVAYHRLLADERDPAERGAGLREWGSGEARVGLGLARRPRRRAARAVPRGRAARDAGADRRRAGAAAAAPLVRDARRGRACCSRAASRTRPALGWDGGCARALRRRRAAPRRRALPPAARPRRRERRAPVPPARRRARLRRLPGGGGARARAPRGALDARTRGRRDEVGD